MKNKVISMMLALIMMLAAAPFAVGASDEPPVVTGKPVMVLDYVKEVIWVDTGNVTNSAEHRELGHLEINEDVVLWYALKVGGTSESALSKAKWLPTYSGAIDISRYVPKKAGATYIIAFKWSDEKESREDNTAFVTLNARQTIAKGSVEYTDGAISAKAEGTFEVRLGDDVWYDTETEWGILIDNKAGDGGVGPLPIPMNFLPTGGAVQVRRPPVDNLDESWNPIEGVEGKFASVPIRVRLPRPSKPVDVSKIDIVPKGGKVEKAHFKGFKDKMEIFVGIRTNNNGTTTEIWHTLEKNMSVADFDKLFEPGVVDGSGKNMDRADKFRFRIRNKAVGTKPASPEADLEFDREVYTKAAEVPAETVPNPEE